MENKFFNNLVNQDENNNINNSNNNNNTNDSWSSNETGDFSQLETNKKNSDEFEKVMTNAAKNYDSYLDRNNPFVKIVLFCILAFVILGCLYYAILWFGNN